MLIKKWIFSFLILVTIFPCYADTPSIVNLPPTLALDDEIWELGYSHEDNDIKTGNYVTNNENMNNWTQLVTIQKFKYYFPKEVAPVVFANNEIMQLKNKHYSLIYTVIESNPQEAMIEFRILKPESEQQDELQRLIRTVDNELVVFHYAIRKQDMGVTERNNWITLLKNMNLSILDQSTINQSQSILGQR